MVHLQHRIDWAGDARRLRAEQGVMSLRQIGQQQCHRRAGGDTGAVEGVGRLRHARLEGRVVNHERRRVRIPGHDEAQRGPIRVPVAGTAQQFVSILDGQLVLPWRAFEGIDVGLGLDGPGICPGAVGRIGHACLHV